MRNLFFFVLLPFFGFLVYIGFAQSNIFRVSWFPINDRSQAFVALVDDYRMFLHAKFSFTPSKKKSYAIVKKNKTTQPEPEALEVIEKPERTIIVKNTSPSLPKCDTNQILQWIDEVWKCKDLASSLTSEQILKIVADNGYIKQKELPQPENLPLNPNNKFVVPYWDGSQLVASQMQANSIGVGIGRAPNSSLDVNGEIRADRLCDSLGNNCKNISAGWAMDHSLNPVLLKNIHIKNNVWYVARQDLFINTRYNCRTNGSYYYQIYSRNPSTFEQYLVGQGICGSRTTQHIIVPRGWQYMFDKIPAWTIPLSPDTYDRNIFVNDFRVAYRRPIIVDY